MFYQVFSPQPALREFVNNIMIFRLDMPAIGKNPTVVLPPLGEQCLYFYPLESPMSEYLDKEKIVKLSPSILVGPQVNRVKLTMPFHSYTVKVGFQPGGLFRILGIPMNEMVMDESLDSVYFLDKEIQFINEQLCELSDAKAIIQLVEGFLLKKAQQLRPVLPVDKVLSLVHQKGGLMTVEDIAENACVSTRQLERLFQQRIGLQPRFFTRITRFAKAWRLKENNPQIKWTSIAYDCGYFDQMHLIRDFKAFCGSSPSVMEDEIKASSFTLGGQL
jgi:AraC-like DNA-binding protein